MTHTPLHTARGKPKFSRRREDMNRGIANPHLGFPRRGLYTGRDPRIDNTAGRMMQYSPNPHLERGTRRFEGRPMYQSQASRAVGNRSIPDEVYQDRIMRMADNQRWSYEPPFDDTVTEIPIRPGSNLAMDAATMTKDISTLPPELFESMSINEGEQAGWRIGENPYFGMKRWNQNDIEGQTWGVNYTSEPETPWDNWFGNLIRKLGGRNRGGLASLRYAR